MAIQRKGTVNFGALKGVIRNGTHEKEILFLQITLIQYWTLICCFMGSFLWALVTTVISEPLKRPRSLLCCVKSVNFGRIKVHYFLEFLKTAWIVTGVCFELIYDLSGILTCYSLVYLYSYIIYLAGPSGRAV